MRRGSHEKPRPQPRGEERHFFETAARELIGIGRCRSCGEHFLPRVICPSCWSSDVEQVVVEGRGTLHSFTVCHRAAASGFEADLPYVVALVELEQGVRVLSTVVDIEHDALWIEMPLRADFEDRGDGLVVPVFVPEVQA